MTVIPFDTLEFANHLKSAGFTEEQATAIIDIQRKASVETIWQTIHDFHLEHIATKRDLKELEREMKDMVIKLEHKIELLRSDTARMIAETKSDLTRWIIGAGFLQTTLIIGVLLKLANLV